MSTRDIEVDLGREQGGHYRTGRIRKPDFRDTDFLIDATRLRGIKPVQSKTRARPWHIGQILDQGNTDQCVIYAYAQFIQSAPTYLSRLDWKPAEFTTRYHLAQKNDEIPGENYAGTTARGAMKVAVDKGEIEGYLWVPAQDGEDIAREWLLTRGTLMQGTDWPAAFFSPDKHGYVEPGDSPRAALGHETLVRWYYHSKHYKYPDTYECVNSWGPNWGHSGRFFVKADVFRWLHWQCGGDLVSPIETARVRAGHAIF